MYVCVECKEEMQCEKTGVYALYGESHAYPGDKFKCPSCKKEILATNKEPIFFKNAINILKENHMVKMLSK